MTEKEVRQQIKYWIKHDPEALLRVFGFRVSRKTRAISAAGLRKPSPAEWTAALFQVEDGEPVHEVEAHWANLGIRVTRNKLSRAMGARP